jgi:hypothetical protein
VGVYLLLKFSKKVSERQDGTVCMPFEREKMSITGYDRVRLSSYRTFENTIVRLVLQNLKGTNLVSGMTLDITRLIPLCFQRIGSRHTS